MQKTILILSLLVCFAMSTHYEELNHLWNVWKVVHDKEYTVGEDSARYAIFVDNYDKVIQYNAQHSNVKLRLNQFADLTSEEFKHQYTGCARYEDDEEFVKAHTMPYEGVEYPDSVDWRNNGIVTGVKNQGQCGSCWTFSTTGVLEGYHALTTGQLLSFSEQQIVDCGTGAGQGCGGGWPYLAIAYAASAGMEQESQYPYTGQDGSCYYNSGYAVRTNDGYAFVGNYNVDSLKSALSSMPVSVLIEADQQVFQFYSSGVVDSGCGASLDHAVLAVGYAPGYFIVKNSWGGGWGQGGYVLIADDGSANGGAGACGILSQPVVPN